MLSLLSTAGKGYGKIVIGRVQITRVGSVQSWEGLDQARDVWIRFLPRMIIKNLMTKGKEMNVAFMDLKRDMDRENSDRWQAIGTQESYERKECKHGCQ